MRNAMLGEMAWLLSGQEVIGLTTSITIDGKSVAPAYFNYRRLLEL